MKDRVVSIIVAVAAGVVIVIALTWIAGGELPDPANRDIGRPPLDLLASNVTFASGSGSLIHAWLSPGEAGKGAVILLHGSRGDRRDMVTRAQFLHSRGIASLLVDFQAHGETRGRQVTFGDLESRDFSAAIQYLHHKLPHEKVAVIGASLGAAAVVLSEDRPEVSAIVLEQMYSTIEQAVSNRARLKVGPLAPLLAPLLMIQMQSRVKIPENRLNVIDRMGKLGAPVLIVNGTRDSYTSIEDAQAQLAAAAPPKELWAVEGAGHVDLYAFAKSQYQKRVGDFLSRYLQTADSASPAASAEAAH